MSVGTEMSDEVSSGSLHHPLEERAVLVRKICIIYQGRLHAFGSLLLQFETMFFIPDGFALQEKEQCFLRQDDTVLRTYAQCLPGNLKTLSDFFTRFITVALFQFRPGPKQCHQVGL